MSMRLSFLPRDKLSHTYVDSRCWGPLQSELRRINQRHFAQSKKNIQTHLSMFLRHLKHIFVHQLPKLHYI